MIGECAVCQQPSTSACGGCKLVFYCGKEHQKNHWKSSHKTDCSPLYKIEHDPILGRYMSANRDIKPGQLIFQEPPLVTGPKSISVPICLGCYKLCSSDGYHECDGCGFPLCRPQCQVSDLHFDECRMLMERKYRIKINPEQNKKEAIYMCVLPLRCLALQGKRDKFNKLIQLQDHVQERVCTPFYEMYRQNLTLLKGCLGKDFDEKLLLKIIGILDTNCFEIRKGKSKIRGLYALASMMEHNCVPNTRHVFVGEEWTMAVYSTVLIKKGEHIKATYTHSLWPTISRRQHLKMVKCFDCICERCSDPTELGTYIGAIRCTRCASVQNYEEGPKIISTDPLDLSAPWKCTACAHKISGKQIVEGNKILQEEVGSINKTVPHGLEQFLAKYSANSGGILHPTNTHVIQVKYALIQMLGNISGHMYSDISDEQLQNKIDYCHALLDIIDNIDPGSTRLRGLVLCELQTAMTIQAKRDYTNDRITKDEAQKILAECLVLLSEAIEILKIEPDMEQELTLKLENLHEELKEN